MNSYSLIFGINNFQILHEVNYIIVQKQTTWIHKDA